MDRVVVWFSCGAASAVAGKLSLEKYGADRVHLVYCNTLASEHPDNLRFLHDVERWLGVKVEVISSKLYQSIDEVFERTRYMAGIAGARCTVEMKKKPRFEFQSPSDTHVFGMLADEGRRITNLENSNPELKLDWILRDKGFYKKDCLKVLEDAGIPIPIMYTLGFKNNNCIGCVKASSVAYWRKVKSLFPEVFARRVQQCHSLKAKLAMVGKKHIYIDEIPDGKDIPITESISCGPDCTNKVRG